MEIYNTFQFATEEDRTKLDVLKSKFEEYMNPRKNNVFETYRFWEYKHQEGEIIDQFITELKPRAKFCKFGDQYDSMIRDRIVFGVSDTRLKERLLCKSSDLTLEKAVDKSSQRNYLSGHWLAREVLKIQFGFPICSLVEQQLNLNWIPELKPTYYHLVFALNSGTNPRC